MKGWPLGALFAVVLDEWGCGWGCDQFLMFEINVPGILLG
jgi:hypothetical protein